MDNDVTVDMRTYGDDRGTYYAESKRCIINLNQHESLDDILKTIQHELLHFCFDNLGHLTINSSFVRAQHFRGINLLPHVL